MTPPVDWKRLTPQEAAQLDALCFREGCWTEEDYHSLGENSHFRVWGAGPPEEPCWGFVAIMQLPPEVEILRLGVVPEYRRQGLGSQLLLLLQAYGREAHCRTCWLEVHEANQAAQALYQCNGFVPTGRRKHYYRHPPGDALLLKWDWA